MAKRARRGRGEGSIVQLKDGTWRGAISLGYVAGKRQRAWVRGATKAEVMQGMQDLRNGGPIVTDVKNLTVTEFLTRWLKDAVEPAVDEATHRSYAANVRLHIVPAIGHKLLREITPLHLQSLYSSMVSKRIVSKGRKKKAKPVAASGRMGQYVHSILRSAFRQAVDWGLVPTSPVARARSPKPQKFEAHPLDEHQIKPLMLAAESERLGPLIVLAVQSGARQGELLALTWPDVDFDGQCISINKTLGPKGVKPPKTKAGRRTIDLPKVAINALQEHRKRMLIEGQAGKGLVFPSIKGTHLAFSVATAAMRRMLAAAELPVVRFHDLRHTHATLLLKSGENIKVVQQRLGHATSAITLDTYSHVMPSMKNQVRENLERLFG